MTQTTRSQQRILEKIIFPESYHNLKEETGLSRGELRDDLTTLMHRNMIEVFEEDSGTQGPKVRHFDNDHPENYFYRATKSGLDEIKRT